jgi:hypothetical protein
MTGMVARRRIAPSPAMSCWHDGLLQHRHPVLLEHGQHADGLRHRPAAVGVDADLAIGGVAQRAQDRLVPVGAQLHLENGILGGLEHLRPDLLLGIEPDGERGLRCGLGVEAPHPMQRHADPLRREVVQRHGERHARRGIAAQHPRPLRLGRLEVERVGGHRGGVEVDGREHRLGRFAVELRRRRLAPALAAVLVGDLHPYGAIVARAAARDDERVAGAELEDLGADTERGGHGWSRCK